MSQRQVRGTGLATTGQAAAKRAHPVFHKTQMCSFYLRGACNRGEACMFAHHQEELKPVPDFTCTRVCERLIATGCCDIQGCKYAHNRDELRKRKSKAKGRKVASVVPPVPLPADLEELQHMESAQDFLEVVPSVALTRDSQSMPRSLALDKTRWADHEAEDDDDDVLELDKPWSRQSTPDVILETGSFSRQTSTDSEWQGFPAEEEHTPAGEEQVLDDAVQRGVMQGCEFVVKNSFLHFGPSELLPTRRSCSLPPVAVRQ